jgi:hypothetical protein
MNDVLILVLAIVTFASIMPALAWWQEGCDIERRKKRKAKLSSQRLS